jgi:hypothetical protein
LIIRNIYENTKTIYYNINILLSITGFAQFGKNKIHIKDYDWYYIQTKHFDIYFSQDGETLTEFTAKSAEDAVASIQNTLNYRVNNRINNNYL